VQTSVTVSDAAVELTALQVFLVTGVAWQAAASAMVAQVPASSSFTATAQLQHLLKAEGIEVERNRPSRDAKLTRMNLT